MMVPNLPPEVVEKILWFLDGASLAKAQQVCTTWRQLVNGLQQRQDIWRACCLEEIPLDTLTEMLGNRFCPHRSQDHHIHWARLYQQWHRMTRVGKWDYTYQTFSVSVESPVTCVKITGSFVVTGHRNGDLHLWDRVEGRHIVKLGHHRKMVLDMALMDLEYEGPYYFPDRELDRQLVISGGKDHVIQVNPIVANSDWLEEWRPFPMPVILRHHSDSIQCIKTFGNVVLASCADNTLSMWTLKISPDISWWPQISLSQILIGPSSFLRWVGFWNNTVTCLCHDAQIWKFDVETSERWKSSALQLIPRKDLKSVELIITNCFLFRDSIIVFLTVDRHFCISVDGTNFRAIPTLASLKGYVVAVQIVGNLLVIGTETGKVFIYYFKTKTDLLHVELDDPRWSSQVSEASVIAIDVHNNSKGPVVAVTTTDSLTVIQWCQFRNETQNAVTVSLENLCLDLKSICNCELVDSKS